MKHRATLMLAALVLAVLAACTAVRERFGQTTQAVGPNGETVAVDADASTFAAPASITVTWSLLPGNTYDWIALSPSGSSVGTYSQWVYTNGAMSGSTTFNGVGVGSWVARAFLNNSFTLLDESTPF